MPTPAQSLLLARPTSTLGLTLSGNEITDVSRAAGVQGDGRVVPDGSFGVWRATTNLITNGGFETNVTGWNAPSGTNTFARSTEQAKFGSASGKATYIDNAQLAIWTATITAAIHTFSLWVYVPTAYDGTGLRLEIAGFTSATGTLTALVDLAKRDQWQRVSTTFTPDAGDVAGTFRLNEPGTAPTSGRFVYLDGAQIEAQPFATPYVETDGGTASRTAGRVQIPVAGLFTPTQGWIAVRGRIGYATSAAADDLFWFMWMKNGDNTTRLSLLQTGAANTWTMIRRSGGVGDGSASTQALAAGAVFTLIGRWNAANVYISVNGAVFTAAANTSIGVVDGVTADLLSDGPDFVGNRQANSDALWVATGEGILTNADAIALHAYGNVGPTIGSSPRMTGLWQANNGYFLRRI